GAAREAAFARRGRPALESAQALERVLRPADALAELAVARHVDAGGGLLAHYFGDRARQACTMSALVVGLPGLLGADERQQRRGTDQAADVRGQDALGAAPHPAILVVGALHRRHGARRFAGFRQYRLLLARKPGKLRQRRGPARRPL